MLSAVPKPGAAPTGLNDALILARRLDAHLSTDDACPTYALRLARALMHEVVEVLEAATLSAG